MVLETNGESWPRLRGIPYSLTLLNTVATVLSQKTLERLDEFWAREIGCTADNLRGQQRVVIAPIATDGSECARVFRRGSGRVLICSPGLTEVLERAEPDSPSGLDDEAFLRDALGNRVAKMFSRVYLGYAETRRTERPESPARRLSIADLSTLDDLRASVSATEWEHSGIDESQPLAGCFVDSKLVAAAGYEVWNGWIAHVGVVTAPQYRQRGFGRDVVAQIANHAISRGLIAQYRTLGSNQGSMAIASALGFCAYGEYTYVVVGEPPGDL